jgi:modification methylase
VQVGQELYFKKTNQVAIILADGRLRLGEKTGSIHTLGRELLGAPCNGWEYWFLIEGINGEKIPLNDLREKYLKKANEG